MRIEKIKCLSESGQEAEVLVSSDVSSFEVWAFCHPCILTEKSILQEPLFGVFTEIYSSSERDFKLEELSEWCAYNFVGKLTDASKGIVDVGGIMIMLDAHMPGDLCDGDWVEGTCGRIDI